MPDAYAGRWMRIARAKVTGRMLITGPRHLLAILDSYAAHDNQHHPHRARNLLPPGATESTPAVITDLTMAKIRRRRVLGGLLNEYEHVT